MKTCKHCRVEQSFDQFSPHSQNGYQAMCKTCMKPYRKRLKEQRYARDPLWKRYANVWTLYKLSREEYDRLAENGCMACGSREGLVVDHDHKCCPGKYTCGKCVRGILCDYCNRALGSSKDNIDRLNGLARYLETTNVQNL